MFNTSTTDRHGFVTSIPTGGVFCLADLWVEQIGQCTFLATTMDHYGNELLKSLNTIEVLDLIEAEQAALAQCLLEADERAALEFNTEPEPSDAEYWDTQEAAYCPF